MKKNYLYILLLRVLSGASHRKAYAFISITERIWGNSREVIVASKELVKDGLIIHDRIHDHYSITQEGLAWLHNHNLDEAGDYLRSKPKRKTILVEKFFPKTGDRKSA